MPTSEVALPGNSNGVDRLILGASTVRCAIPALFNGCCPGVCFADEAGSSGIAPCGGYYLPVDGDV